MFPAPGCLEHVLVFSGGVGVGVSSVCAHRSPGVWLRKHPVGERGPLCSGGGGFPFTYNVPLAISSPNLDLARSQSPSGDFSDVIDFYHALKDGFLPELTTSF